MLLAIHLKIRVSCLVLGIVGGFSIMCAAQAGDFTLLKGLADYQVLQRSATDTVTLRVEGGAPIQGKVKATIATNEKTLEAFNGVVIGDATGGSWQGKLLDIPAGGPYTIQLNLEGADGTPAGEIVVQRILVGDLWILAGQSNMEGVGNMAGVEEPSDRINVFRMRHQWDEAREPIHRLFESVDRVHYFDRRGDKPLPSLEEANNTAAQATKGAGLGLPFAKQMVARTGIPVGLVPVAHGGTSMDQWSPNERAKGGDSLYGSFLEALRAVGGKARGMLWYQGESDAASEDLVKTYGAKFTAFVEAVRQDTGDPNFPIYTVQIGCVAELPQPLPFTPSTWNGIQDLQRRLELTIPGTGVVSSIDLPLDDVIHIGTDGLKRLGKRLANLALGSPSLGPRLDRIERTNEFLRVIFTGGSGKLLSPKGRVSGFSIRDTAGTDLRRIYKATVDAEQPNSVLLYYTDIPEGAVLWYGYGLMPFCNLTDTEDMAVMVMGPIEIPKS